MGITVVFANGTGVGKTSFLTAKMKQIVLTEGRARLRKSIDKIEYLNKTRGKPLSIPNQYPIYSNYEAEFKTGYKKTYSPYRINEYYFGLPKQGKTVMPVLPYSAIFFHEMDDAYNNHGVPAVAVRSLYNKRRHWNLDIWIELHRAMSLNIIIRDIADLIIEIRDKKSVKDFAGRTIRTTWTCREFKNWRDVEKYMETGEKLYVETTFTNEGDIFKCYDCENCAAEFVPDEGDDFSMLPQESKVDVHSLPPEIAKFYQPGKPETPQSNTPIRQGNRK